MDWPFSPYTSTVSRYLPYRPPYISPDLYGSICTLYRWESRQSYSTAVVTLLATSMRSDGARNRRGLPSPPLAALHLLLACTAAARSPSPPATDASHRPLPVPHRQFSTRIETTAHQLNATNDYPPYRRYMRVHYDYEARRARIDYEPVPHMPPKSFVRRYDLGFEWMVMEVRHMIARGDAATPFYSF